MCTYIVEGKNNICGSIRLSGAKNFSIKALAASLLARGRSFFSNVPNNLDIHKTLGMLKELGVICFFDEENKECSLDTTFLTNSLSDSENANMTTFLIATALLKYFDTVFFPAMKGCDLGDRLIDFHQLAFEAFGVDFLKVESGYCIQKKREMVGVEFSLNYPSVGATETALFLAVISSGNSLIKNAAIEPEINALIALLTEMGANICFEGDRSIRVVSGRNLNSVENGFIHGDYLEAATWAILAAINDGEIVVEGVIPELIGSFLGAFTMLGGGYKRLSNDSLVFFKGRMANKTVFLETGVFPMLRTDLQPLLAVMAALAHSTTTLIHETVYNNRLNYIDDFNSFGCDLVGFNECLGNKCRYSCSYKHSAVIKGVLEVNAVKSVQAKTVRSGAALVLLASVAKGVTEITSAEVFERGYCSFYEKLKMVGVSVKRA